MLGGGKMERLRARPPRRYCPGSTAQLCRGVAEESWASYPASVSPFPEPQHWKDTTVVSEGRSVDELAQKL